MQNQLYQLLAGMDDAVIDRAIADAVPTADEQGLRQITELLLGRRNEEGKFALVRCYAHLPATIRGRIVAEVRQFFGALREAAQLRQGDAPANALHIILEGNEPRLAYLIVDLLVHGSSAYRIQAAECLLAMAHRRGQPGDPAAAADFLQQAVEQAVTVYEAHRQSEVLRALATLAPRPTPTAWSALSEGTSHKLLQEDMRRMMSQAANPEIRGAMLAWVRHPQLKTYVLAGLAKAAELGQLHDVLGNVHLLLDGAVRQSLSALNHGGKPVIGPSAAQAEAWPANAAAALPAWIMALPLPTHDQAARLAALAALPERRARLAALRRLLALPVEAGPDVPALIAGFCDDADGSIARIAFRHLLHRPNNAELPALLLRMVNARHAEIRQTASLRVAAMGYERFWHAWPRLDADQRIAAGRALIKLDPSFHQHLGKALSDPDIGKQLRALAIIYGLNQGDLFEPALLTLAASPDTRLASAAIRAMATAHSPQAIASLTRALNHPDSRVRANAIEALQQARASANVDRLAEMAQVDEGRPRANAIGALLEMRTGEAFTALRTMLDDNRPNHRVSALWLVESMGLIELATHVAELALRDHDQHVKGRADRVIHRLLQIMQPTSIRGITPPAVAAA